MRYINVKTSEGTETIDEFESRFEAREMLTEYRMAGDFYAGAYISARCTNDWRNR